MKIRWSRLADFIFVGFLLLCLAAGTGGVYYHGERLQAQAFEAHRQFSVLDNRYSADFVFQTINSVGLTLRTLLEAGYDNYSAQEWELRFRDALRHAPHMRSLSLLNEADKVVASSHPANLGKQVDAAMFVPRIEPWESTLQVGPAFSGRDLADGVRPGSDAEAPPPVAYLPLRLSLSKGEGARLALVAIVNIDFLLNRLDAQEGIPRWIDVVRYDGALLFSNREAVRPPAVVEANRALALRWQGGQEMGLLTEDFGAGQRTISVFRSDRILPLSVVTRVEEVHALGDARQEARSQLFTLLPLLFLSLFVVLVAYLLFRRTLLRRMEDQTRELERLGQLIDALPAGVLLFGGDGRVVAGNRSWQETARAHALPLGESGQHYAGLAGALSGEPGSVAALREGIAAVLNDAGEYAGEFRFEGPLGARWFQLFVRPFMRGQQRGAVLLQLDITERRLAEEALRLNSRVFEVSAEAILVTDAQNRIVSVNPAFTRITGYEAAEALGRNPRFLASGEQPPGFYREMWSGLLERGFWQGEIVNRRKSGQCYAELLTISCDRDESGQLRHFIGVFSDISARKVEENRLRLLEAALAAAANAVVITDRDANIEWVNPAFSQLTGYGREEAIGRKPKELVRSGLQPADFYRQLWDTILAGEVWRGEVVNKRKDGTLYDEALTITPVHDGQGSIAHFVAIKEDISLRKRQEEELLRLATTDPLTGAFNRRAFLEMAESERVRYQRYDHPACLLMLDLDHFKRVNDAHGHAAGDAVLLAFATMVRTCLRESDVLGRLGGEEFAVLLVNTDAEGGGKLARRLCQRVGEMPVAVGEKTIPITVSIGMAPFRSDDAGIEAILLRADEALYRAKALGRNRVEEALADEGAG